MKERTLKRSRPASVQVPGPGQESVWDYPRPPRLEPVSQRIRIEFAGQTIADTSRANRVCETASPPTYYLPLKDIKAEYLQPSDRTTFCEWKGAARYWSVRVGNRIAQNAAWSYPEPEKDFEPIRDYLAFYPGKMDACYIGDEKVNAQAGDFYGGWITKNIVGPFKGKPGTEGW